MPRRLCAIFRTPNPVRRRTLYFETELDGLASALHNLIERSRMCRLRDFLL